MKYCKKCFRNVREDVNVCPYCGAPGLEEYGSAGSGEAFTSTVSTVPKSAAGSAYDDNSDNDNDTDNDDDYKRRDRAGSRDPFFDFGDEQTDAYGNVTKNNVPQRDAYGSKPHDDEECENAPDDDIYEPKKWVPGTEPDPSSSQYKMRIEYLNMLKKIDGISRERIEELMKRYDETHGRAAVKPYISTSTRSVSTVNTSGLFGAAIVCFIIGLFSPVMGIIFLIFIRSRMLRSNDENAERQARLCTVFITILAVFVIFMFLGIGLGALSSIWEAM